MLKRNSAKEEEVYLKQRRHLQEKIKRCELACEGHEKNIKTYKAKCINTEQETRDVKECLEFELVKKEQRLLEVQQLLEQQKAASKQELEEIDKKNNKSLQKLQDQLDELISNLSKLKAKQAEMIKEVQQQIQSRKNQLVLKQKDHEAAVKELKEEQLDPKMVARVLKETEEAQEKEVRNEFLNLTRKERDCQKMCRENLVFLVDNTPKVREQRDLLISQIKKYDQSMMDMDQSLFEASAENIVLKQKAQRLQKMKSLLQSEVQDLKFTVEDHKRNMQSTREHLSCKLAKMSATLQNRDKEINHLKAAIKAESSRHTELKMAMKEADIIFKDILKEPQMDPQKLRRLHTILESYAPWNK